ncbi:MAG TPA: low molecular weight protein arginine phosphatase [Opitutaceae bacterium]|nr:low molecular weight protein arginine phosphatase [Opitutaceae bacterium]
MNSAGYVIMICTANICRSPMAAGLLAHALAAQPEPLRSIKVISAGVSCRAGETVSPNSVTAMKKVGIDISGHESQPLTQELVSNALAIFGMTETHRTVVQLQFFPEPGTLFLFREFLPEGAHREIADPFGGPLSEYETSRDEMVEAIPSVVAFLKERTSRTS